MRLIVRLIALMAVALVATGAFAQGTGTTSSLSGTVTTGGKALPGVTVTITSPALLGTRTAVTGESGGYSFQSLPPGSYTVTFELEGLQKVIRKATLSLGQPSVADADLKVSTVTEAITVTAAAPAVLETTEVSRNYTQKQIADLPVRRNVRDTVLLAPGTNSNGPNNQITISGAPSYDNLFLVNGVVVNENLRGQPHTLFIEDAIQETTILTGSISAEYGRFTGGVVSSITKSGGNSFTGSLRDTLTNPNWIAKTQFRDAAGHPEPDHADVRSNVYEGTLGGFVLRDRLWFFGAGRHTKGAPADGFNAAKTTLTTNIGFLNTLNEDRFEGKLTGQVTQKHSLVASYLKVKTTEINNFFGSIYDVASIVPSRQLPNSLKALAYNGVLTNNWLLEGQVSQKKFAFIHSGGQDKDRINGTLLLDSNARFNAPTFCGVCTPEERNNDSAVLKSSYYMNTKNLGNHSFVLGGELYKETRLVNNNQEASDFRVTSTGTAIFLPGDPTPYPRFDASTVLQWQPILVLSTGSHLNTKSAFANDKWDLSNRWSFNIGVRYDKNVVHDASGNLVSDDSAFAPRLGVIWDVAGNGSTRVNASYATYVTKIVDGNVGGAGNAAGTPASFRWAYRGPNVNPIDASGKIIGTPVAPHDALRILFNWFDSIGGTTNTNFLSSSYPGYTQRILSPIQAPSVDEITLGFGQMLGRTAFARVDLIDRRWHDFYALKLNQSTGQLTAPNGVTNDLAILVNDNDWSKRHYEGAQLNFGWRPGKFNVGGGWTIAKLTGNDTTESDLTASSPITVPTIYYPEYLSYANYAPSGYLYGDQRHRGKLYGGYDFTLPLGKLNASVIENIDSGRAYSAIGTVDPTGTNANFRYTGAPTKPAYYTLGQLGTSTNYYFSKRGAFRTPWVTATDLALNYELPISRASIFVQGQVLNIFNQSKLNNIVLGQLDTAINTSRSAGLASGLKPFNPYTDTPVECPQGAAASVCTSMGANWQKAPTFGQGLSKDAFQQARTYRAAVGVRF